MGMFDDLLTGGGKNPSVYGVKRVDPNEPIDQIPEPGEIALRPRIFQYDVSFGDEMRFNITMSDGQVGTITIKAATLVQVILDRNQREAVAAANAGPEIQVGDGGIAGTVIPKMTPKSVTADDLLEASKAAKTRSYKDELAERNRQAMLKAHGLKENGSRDL